MPLTQGFALRANGSLQSPGRYSPFYKAMQSQ